MSKKERLVIIGGSAGGPSAAARAKRMLIKLIFDRRNGRLLGAQIAGKEGVARRINALAVAVHQKMSVDEIAKLDFAYAPPFSPPLDPILIAAEQAAKKIQR